MPTRSGDVADEADLAGPHADTDAGISGTTKGFTSSPSNRRADEGLERIRIRLCTRYEGAARLTLDRWVVPTLTAYIANEIRAARALPNARTRVAGKAAIRTARSRCGRAKQRRRRTRNEGAAYLAKIRWVVSALATDVADKSGNASALSNPSAGLPRRSARKTRPLVEDREWG